MLVTLLLSACSKDTTAPPPFVANVVITPTLDSLIQTDTVRFHATAVDDNGNPIASRIAWSSGDTARLRIDSAGLARALGPGLVVITASPPTGGQSGSLILHVLPAIASLAIFPVRTRYVVGGSYHLLVVPHDSQGQVLTGRRVAWSVSDPSVLMAATTGDSAESLSVHALTNGAAIVHATLVSGATTDTVVVESVTFDTLLVGLDHTCGLATDSTAFCWGDGLVNRLGSGSQTPTSAPQGVTGALQYESFASGDVHACGITGAGTTYCWGQDSETAPTSLGSSVYSTHVDSVPVVFAQGTPLMSIFVGGEAGGGVFTCGLDASQAAFCWGLNYSGELGTGDTVTHLSPTAVSGGLHFSTLVLGAVDACGLTVGGKIYCWGAGGLLGDSTLANPCSDYYADTCTPNPVAASLTFSWLTGQGQAFCALTPTGDAYCWGRQAEVGPATHVALGYQFLKIVTSDTHVCGIQLDHTAVCWGANDNGELGNGSFTSSPTTPVPVSGGLTFKALSVGAGTSCGLTQAGVAYCWGLNASGQLGDGTLVNSNKPVRVLGQP